MSVVNESPGVRPMYPTGAGTVARTRNSCWQRIVNLVAVVLGNGLRHLRMMLLDQLGTLLSTELQFLSLDM